MLPVFFLLGIGLKVYWDVEFEKSYTAWQLQKQQVEMQRTNVFNALRTLRSGLTVREIETRLSMNVPLQLVPATGVGDPDVVFESAWSDKLSGYSIQFYFDANMRFTYYDGDISLNTLGSPSYWDKSLLQETVEFIGNSLPILILLVWLPLLLAFIDRSRQRGWLSWMLAATSAGCLLIWTMDPSVAMIDGEVLGSGHFWLGLGMVVVAGLCIWKGGWRDRVTNPLQCVGCGYSLLGNKTGTCPECGAVMPVWQRQVVEVTRHDRGATE